VKGEVLYKSDFQNWVIVTVVGRGLSSLYAICIDYKTTHCFENISID